MFTQFVMFVSKFTLSLSEHKKQKKDQFLKKKLTLFQCKKLILFKINDVTGSLLFI
jgi:hypothetical protein